MTRIDFRAPFLVFAGCIVLAGCPDDATENGDASGDAGADVTRDGTTTGDDTATGDSGGTLPATGESLAISYVSHTRDPNSPMPEWRLFVIDEDCEPDACDPQEITGTDFSCQLGCQATPSLSHVLWTDPAVPGNLMAAEVNPDSTLGTARVLANNVELWHIGPERVVFLRSGTVYSVPIAGGNEIELLSVRGEVQAQGGFYYAASIDRVFVTRPISLSAMDLWEVSATDPSDNRVVFRFISEDEQSTGSLYQGQQTMAVSPDGQLLALVLDAKDTGATCMSDGPNTCPLEYSCSTLANRCISEQTQLHIINLGAADQLHTPDAPARCSASSECGTYHVCDLSALDESQLGICTPNKYIVGPFGGSVCGMTDAEGGPFVDDGEYNNVVDALMWRSDGHLLFVGSDSCEGTNIPVTNIVSLPPDLSAPTLVLEHAAENYPGSNCYSEVEERFDPPECVIEIHQARMSPSGNTIVFRGSGLTSERDTEVWLIDAFGRGGKQILTQDVFNEVESINVHPPR